MLLIRRVSEKDIEAIVNLQVRWENEGITYGFKAADVEYLRAYSKSHFFVAEDKGRLVGFIYGDVEIAENMNIYETGTKYIEIEDLYVDKEYRSEGVGKKLCDMFLETSELNGIQHAYLSSATKDIHKIIKFYEACGFKSWTINMFK